MNERLMLKNVTFSAVKPDSLTLMSKKLTHDDITTDIEN